MFKLYIDVFHFQAFIIDDVTTLAGDYKKVTYFLLFSQDYKSVGQTKCWYYMYLEAMSTHSDAYE